MIKATKNADGTITIHTDQITAERIWAMAETTATDDENGEETRKVAREVAREVAGTLNTAI